MSHIWMSHVTHINESCHTYEWPVIYIIHMRLVPRIWMRHVTRRSEPCHANIGVVMHIIVHMSVVSYIYIEAIWLYVCTFIWLYVCTWDMCTHMNESCVIYILRLYFIYIKNDVTHMNESCVHMGHVHTYERVRCHIYIEAISARPYESCKKIKGRPRRNAFSKLVHRQYKLFPPDRFCQVEMKNPTRMSNKPVTHDLVRRIRFWRIKISGTWF